MRESSRAIKFRVVPATVDRFRSIIRSKLGVSANSPNRSVVAPQQFCTLAGMGGPHQASIVKMSWLFELELCIDINLIILQIFETNDGLSHSLSCSALFELVSGFVEA